VSGGEVARQLLQHLGQVALVWVILVAGVFLAGIAARGRPAYWLGAAGSVLAVFGLMLGPGFLPATVTSTAIGAGIALAVFGVALDLLLGPAEPPAQGQAPEGVDSRFE
jgi:uncharacterized membrane protein YccC